MRRHESIKIHWIFLVATQSLENILHKPPKISTISHKENSMCNLRFTQRFHFDSMAKSVLSTVKSGNESCLARHQRHSICHSSQGNNKSSPNCLFSLTFIQFACKCSDSLLCASAMLIARHLHGIRSLSSLATTNNSERYNDVNAMQM